MSKKPAKLTSYPEFLKELLEAKSPTGHEFAAQKVIDDHVEKSADKYSKDALGNRIAELKGDGGPTLMFAGHIDEIGLIISHVDDKGYLYFEFLGGHDQIIPSGRRLHILTRNGPVLGITGKRAVHLLSPEDRKRVPERHDMWIDIGVNNRADALAIVRIGDPAIYTDGPEILRGSIGVARAFDDKAGAYVCMEAFRRLSKEKKLAARVVSVATTQEEIGTPIVYDLMVEAAESIGIPYQIGAESRPTGTDARAIQMANGGVACGLLSIPLRYMHTPGEVVDLAVVEQSVQLLVEFARRVKKKQSYAW
ncbi:MAG: M42 family peptidase [Verrucomicrobia bacterium]|nr:M42 family peptidase [Verrucomicrobiota bacterium]